MKLQESTDAGRSMLDITVTSKGIEKLLSNLNPHKAACPDQIKPIIIKNFSTPLSPILKHLFQKSLDSGTLPPIWKDANVAPLFLINMNDLRVNVKSKVRLFADDTALYLTISTSSQSEILQKDLDNLERWSHTWDMEFNPSKRPSHSHNKVQKPDS